MEIRNNPFYFDEKERHIRATRKIIEGHFIETAQKYKNKQYNNFESAFNDIFPESKHSRLAKTAIEQSMAHIGEISFDSRKCKIRGRERDKEINSDDMSVPGMFDEFFMRDWFPVEKEEDKSDSRKETQKEQKKEDGQKDAEGEDNKNSEPGKSDSGREGKGYISPYVPHEKESNIQTAPYDDDESAEAGNEQSATQRKKFANIASTIKHKIKKKKWGNEYLHKGGMRAGTAAAEGESYSPDYSDIERADTKRIQQINKMVKYIDDFVGNEKKVKNSYKKENNVCNLLPAKVRMKSLKYPSIVIDDSGSMSRTSKLVCQLVYDLLEKKKLLKKVKVFKAGDEFEQIDMNDKETWACGDGSTEIIDIDIVNKQKSVLFIGDGFWERSADKLKKIKIPTDMVFAADSNHDMISTGGGPYMGCRWVDDFIEWWKSLRIEYKQIKF